MIRVSVSTVIWKTTQNLVLQLAIHFSLLWVGWAAPLRALSGPAQLAGWLGAGTAGKARKERPVPQSSSLGFFRARQSQSNVSRERSWNPQGP